MSERGKWETKRLREWEWWVVVELVWQRWVREESEIVREESMRMMGGGIGVGANN